MSKKYRYTGVVKKWSKTLAIAAIPYRYIIYIYIYITCIPATSQTVYEFLGLQRCCIPSV